MLPVQTSGELFVILINKSYACNVETYKQLKVFVLYIEVSKETAY
jgi:hypothetical protein